MLGTKENLIMTTLPITPPEPNVTVTATLKSHSGKIQTADLIHVNEDDVTWRTADDLNELDEMNWDVVAWEYPERPTLAKLSIRKQLWAYMHLTENDGTHWRDNRLGETIVLALKPHVDSMKAPAYWQGFKVDVVPYSQSIAKAF